MVWGKLIALGASVPILIAGEKLTRPSYTLDCAVIQDVAGHYPLGTIQGGQKGHSLEVSGEEERVIFSNNIVTAVFLPSDAGDYSVGDTVRVTYEHDRFADIMQGRSIGPPNCDQ